MQSVASGVFWCPNCGTLKFRGGVPEWEPPNALRTILRNLVHCDDTTPRDEPGPITGPLWAKVAHLFGLGSTSASQLCSALDMDPNAKRQE
jgi:hypothetical protein